MKNLIALLFLVSSLGSFSQMEKPLFSLLSHKDTGIDFENRIVDTKEQNILLYDNFYGGAGLGIADFNNDGLKDVFFAGNLVANELYINQGDFKFEKITKKAGILSDGGWTSGVTIADVNNDGYPDIYLSRELYDHQPALRRNLLYINNGDLTFTESAEAYGVADTQRTRHASFLDYNKDGYLDLFLLTQPPNPGSYSEYFGTPLLKPEYHLKLYENTGAGTFVDVSVKAGVNLTGFPNAISASDLNNDGWTDIYIANDFQAPDFIFMNNKDGSFTNVANSALNHMSFYSMGVDISDINNDGHLDVFVVDMAAEDNFRLKANMSGMNPKAFWDVVNNGGHYQYMFNTFHMNNGNGTYSDIAQITSMANTDWSWANLVADFDNDGLKDTYVTNGLLRDIRNTDANKKLGQYVIDTANKWIAENPNAGEVSIWDILDLEKALSIVPSQALPNYAFKNHGDLNFENVSAKWGLDQKSFSNGASYADLDNDGDLDLVVNNVNEKAFVYRNNATNHYLRVRLKSKEHLPVLGARIEIEVNGNKQFVELTNVRGIYATSEPDAHFGLEKNTKVDKLKISWPNGNETHLENLKANQDLELFMEDAGDKVESLKDKKTLFTEITASKPLFYIHKENNFDDYEHQVLLPHKLSQFGPALAVGDINNDGLQDVFAGAATGYQAALFLQKENGFVRAQEDLWREETMYEDVDADFVDINGDGYLDLYVVSGGNEFEANDKRYADRLYLNNGKGGFKKSTIKDLRNISGSVVKGNDFDKDGDIDLFVGGRLSPRNYPLPVSSMILINNDGKLLDKSSEIAEGLSDIGMITDAVWSDYDNDGWTDLIVVGEWMPVTIFKNDKGRLIRQETTPLENTRGWWFSIEQGDFDKDGDMDYMAGNLGLNYKYKTSEKAPFDIYYNDFDSNGSFDIVLGYYQENKHYPLRGFSCSSEQIPSLKSTFKKYDIFASLEIEDVYGEENLQQALHYTTDTFASIYLENLGNGDFRITQLPNRVQLSNINDILVNDFNKDGNLDALLTGNLFVSELETTRNDAGTGALLLGDGKGHFEVVLHHDNGFFTWQDAKKLKSLKDDNNNWILVANNNGPLQVFNVE